MCCVGTKILLRDYDYLIRRFIDCNATTKESAVSYEALGIDESEHMFARDNFMSLLFSGDIRRTRKGYYLKNPNSCHFANCKLAQQAIHR